MKVLILDDNAHHSELAARALKREGWKVSIAENSEPQNDWNQYDIMLLDYSMPRKSGLEVLKAMRDKDIRTPVVFLTGHGNEMIASEAIKQGAYDYVVKDTQLLYLDRLPSVIREARSKHELIETNRFLIQELRKATERLQRMTFTDEMTSLHNLRFMRRQLDIEIQRCLRYSKSLSICLIDIDRFKSINDTYGHPAGDSVLRELGQIIRDLVRNVDFVGRYAGDEFLVIFPDTVLSDAVSLCVRIRRRVAEHRFFLNEQEIPVTISIGVADFDMKRRRTVDGLVEAADRCLYQAKRAGRDRVGSSLRLVDSKERTPSVQP